MDLTLVELRRPPDVDRYAWRAFELDERFTHGWWSPNFHANEGNYVEISVLLGDVEVARVELDQTVDYSHYVSAPALGAQALEIQFIDIANGHRGQGIGTEVVHQLARDYPDRRLVAFSEEADGFWASLGWDRYTHPDGDVHYRPLFIQPVS